MKFEICEWKTSDNSDSFVEAINFNHDSHLKSFKRLKLIEMCFVHLNERKQLKQSEIKERKKEREKERTKEKKKENILQCEREKCEYTHSTLLFYVN